MTSPITNYRPKSKWLNWVDSPIVNRLLALGVILSLIASIFSAVKIESLTSCLADYNTSFQATSVARARINQEQIDATNTLLGAFSVVRSREEAKVLYQQYLQTEKLIDKEKADHPIPPPPKKVCR